MPHPLYGISGQLSTRQLYSINFPLISLLMVKNRPTLLVYWFIYQRFIRLVLDYSWLLLITPELIKVHRSALRFCFALLEIPVFYFAYSVFIRYREFFRLIEFSVAWCSLIHHFSLSNTISDRVWGLFCVCNLFGCAYYPFN